MLLELSAEGSELSVERGGIVGQVVEVLVGEGDFAELFFGFREGAVDNASVEIFGEEAGVKDEEGKVGGYSELAHLENVVAGMAVAVEVLLRPVEAEADGATIFVGNPVQVV